jgi:hypothetical protein
MAKNQVTGYGVGEAKIFLAPVPIQFNRQPATTDTRYEIGQQLIFGNSVYELTSITAGSANWTLLGSGSTGGINSITGDINGAEVPLLGNFNLLGTADQINVTGSANTETFSIPSTFIAPGSIASTTTITSGTGLTVTTGGILVSGGDIINSHSDAGTDVTIEVTNSDNTNGASRAGVEIATGGASSGDPYLSFQISGVGASTMTMGLDNSASDLFVISNSTAIGTSNALTLSQAGALTATTSVTATLGDITATNGNLVLNTAGNKIVSTSVASTTTAGANTFGTVALVGGTATVNTSSVTANSMIFATVQDLGTVATAQAIAITAKVASTSFTITSADPTDTSTIAWFIVN